MSTPAPAALLPGKRIVFVLAGQGLGGAERNALELAADLKHREGAAVYVCALDRTEGPARSVAAEHAIPWRTIPVPWSRGRAAKASELLRAAAALRRRRPDVLISTTNLPNVVCGLVWRSTGASLSVWNQEDVLSTTRIRPAVFRRSLAATPLIVVTADHTREWLVERWGADRHRIHVVRSKVELAPARDDRATWRARLGLAETDVAACMIAHLHGGKDHATALRAWRRVLDRYPADSGRPVLLLAGRDGGGEAAAKALAFDLDLRDHVRVLGSVDDVSGLLGASDFAVFSSRSEGLARGAMEPMAAGLAVCGTDVPGVREAVGGPGRALLTPPGDDAALAESILRLATDAELRARIGAGNAMLVRARNGRGETTRVYASLLARALAGGGARRGGARARPGESGSAHA